ncbi:RING/U-box [Panus rudis PR-1116 ss-1]|nr:RING/U-box [Panus rudis PR-1116 ss-1]
MKVTVKNWHAIAQWKWDIGNNEADDGEVEGDVCGICRVPYEGCCPTCKVPGDDCPLIWGECTHVFHMHCLLKWIGTAASKHQCPMDRRPWGMYTKAQPLEFDDSSIVSSHRGAQSQYVESSIERAIRWLQVTSTYIPYASARS